MDAKTTTCPLALLISIKQQNISIMSNSTWPVPKFRFEVDFGTDLKKVSFQEVSGLETETQPIEYRHGDSNQFSAIKMPDIFKRGSVTMKRGIFVNDDAFWRWHEQISMNTIKKVSVSIMLLDERGDITMHWILNNAWPTKITSTDVKSEGNEVAIDTLEIAHEGLTISN